MVSVMSLVPSFGTGPVTSAMCGRSDVVDRRRRESVTMEQDAWLAESFEQHRTRLKAVANRMLGSTTEADDAVQETWLRFSRSDTSAVENLGSWLTTVVSRVCLNMLQARRQHPETPMDPDLHEPTLTELTWAPRRPRPRTPSRRRSWASRSGSPC